MKDDHTSQTAEAFVSAINAHDLERLTSLMSEDHLFVDSLGAMVRGRKAMRQGWLGYFAMVPDYLITIEEIFVTGDKAMLVGRAQGTYTTDGVLRKDNRWESPAAWFAEIHGDCIAQWRVYCDNEPIRAIMRR